MYAPRSTNTESGWTGSPLPLRMPADSVRHEEKPTAGHGRESELVVRRAGPPARTPEPSSLPRMFEDLGPVLTRVGLYLSVRADLLETEQLQPLLRLVDRAPPSPWADVRQQIVDDLGKPPEDLFARFNQIPRASGALTQLHLAQTSDGRDVAVKVLRPGITETVERELKKLDKVLRALDDICGLGTNGRKQLDEDIRLWLRDQMDLGREYRNAVRLHQINLEGQCFRFPEPYDDYSAPRVFTAEFLRGVAFTDLLPVSEGARDRGFSELGLDRRELACNLVESVLQQVFELSLFHAGPHPSHLVALPDNRIGFVGLGFVDRLDSTERDRQLALISALNRDDTERAVGALIDSLGSPDILGLEGFRADLLDRLRRFRREEELTGELALPHHMRAVMHAARSHGVTVTDEMLSFYRAVITAESVATMLSPTSGLRQVARPFFLRLQVRTAVHKLSFNESQSVALDMVDLLTTAPGNLGQLLADLADDRFVFRVATSESEEDRRAGHARARLISIAIVFVGVTILLTGPDITDAGASLRVPGYGLLALVSIALGVLWKRLR